MMAMAKRKPQRQWQAMNPKTQRWVKSVVWSQSTGPKIRWTRNPNHAQLFVRDRILALQEFLQPAGCIPVAFLG